jgi:bifunctional enzyme CysN/CysC
MHIVIAGHVDHGKSTVIGRLLADTGSLPQGKLAAVRAQCERTARPFEYAFLLDALKDEQAQGITIDTARVFFRSAVRDYTLLDAPGHIEFLKNMVSGASHAEAALLVIDANEGIRENSRRHGYLVGMLGIRQLAVLVNKMDLVDYRQPVFERIRAEYARFLGELGLAGAGIRFIPVAAREGANLVRAAARLAWYEGPTVLQALDAFAPERPAAHRPFRMPVQDVYKFTAHGDDRRIVAGTIESGEIRPGDEIVFQPSGKRSRVKTIEGFNQPPPAVAGAGMATGLTLEDQIYVTRGEVVCRAAEPEPLVTTRLHVSLFWMGKHPLERETEYLLKVGTARVPMRVETIHRVLDGASLATNGQRAAVQRHQVGECTVRLSKAVAVDVARQLPATGRFVVVDDHEIRGGGIILEALRDRRTWVRDTVRIRDYKWDASFIPPARRADRYGQQPTLVLITGPRDVDRKGLARELEARLFADGLVVYFLGIGNVVYGVDADLDRNGASRAEHVRRLGEVANIILDAGMILIASAAELTSEELHVIRTSAGPDRVVTSWVGSPSPADMDADLFLEVSGDLRCDTARLRRRLEDMGAFGRRGEGNGDGP